MHLPRENAKAEMTSTANDQRTKWVYRLPSNKNIYLREEANYGPFATVNLFDRGTKMLLKEELLQSGFAIEKLLAPQIFVRAALENEIPRTHSKLLTPFRYWRQLR
jgi:hypothetical protein